MLRSPAQALLRPLHDHEVARATEWAIKEDWNPGAWDAHVFNVADPGSLLTIEVQGQPAGVISAVRMTPTFGFAGFFVLAPEFRRSRHGWYLMQACLERLEDRVIGVESVPERIHNYAHHGLAPHGHTVSYRGLAEVRPGKRRPEIACALSCAMGELIAYDAVNFGVNRGVFLREWLSLPESGALVFRRGSRICGLGAARRCQQGLRIGPLQADDPEAAEALFDALTEFAPGEPISVDCPDTNPQAGRLLRRKGLEPGFTTTRLYRGEPPLGRPDRVFGLMSFSLG